MSQSRRSDWVKLMNRVACMGAFPARSSVVAESPRRRLRKDEGVSLQTPPMPDYIDPSKGPR